MLHDRFTALKKGIIILSQTAVDVVQICFVEMVAPMHVRNG